MDLLETWLRNPTAFVEVGEDRSMLYDIKIGTLKGSILGPVLFSLFVAPMFDTNNIVAYADDSYEIPFFANKRACGYRHWKSTLWFKNSGLKVNEEKTEVAIFFKNNCHLEDVMITGKVIITKTQ
jgi:hypothetical protein